MAFCCIVSLSIVLVVVDLYFVCMKVPFEEVPELVASRRVFLLKGYAYVAMNQVNINLIGCPIYFNCKIVVFSPCLLIINRYLVVLGGIACCHSISQSLVKGPRVDEQVIFESL